MGLLELVTEYDDGRNERGFNPDFGVIENMAFKVFMVQAKQFFAEVPYAGLAVKKQKDKKSRI